MAAGFGSVRVEGLKDLQRAFKQLDGGLAGEIRSTLHKIAAPVAAEASQRASAEITNMTPAWAAMKTGATMRGAYIAPGVRRQGGGSPRPNLSRLLLARAMLPAVENRRADIERGLERMLDRLGSSAGF
jgi:hypothetical protein